MSETKKYLHFGGADFSSSPWEVEDSRAVDMLNLISAEGGFPEKRMGTVPDATYPDEIYGLYRFHSATADELLVHSGTKLYRHGVTPTLIDSRMAAHKSEAKQLENKLIIADGTNLRSYNGVSVTNLKDSAYQPVIAVEGVKEEEYNLLTDTVWEYHTGSVNHPFYTTLKPIADVKAYRFDSSTQTWIQDNCTFNAATGLVTPSVFADMMIHVQYRYTGADALTGQTDIIRSSTLDVYGGRLYVPGAVSRNIDFRSGVNQPAYFPKNQSAVIGGSGTKIVGYLHLTCGRQAILKENDGTLPSVYLRDENEGITEALSGLGVLANNTQGYMENEGLFLTNLGVMAITNASAAAGRPVYAFCRSSRVNTRLLAEPNLSSACAVSFHGYYILSVGGHYYVADGKTEKDGQYEWYYWQAPAATCFCATADTLYFATAGGKLCHFQKGVYSDLGEAFDAFWITPPTALNNYLRKKTVTHAVCLPKPNQRGMVSVDYLVKDSVYRALAQTSTGWLDFAHIDFSDFTFETDRAPRGVSMGKLRNFYALQLRIRAHRGRPFGLYGLVLEYAYGQIYRG